jgi:hypothetical protein
VFAEDELSSLDHYEQFLWTEVYRPKSSKAYLGNATQQIKRLNEWFSNWTEILQNERPKKIPSKKRKRSSDDEDLFDDNIDEDSSRFPLEIHSVDLQTESVRSFIN